MRDETAEEKLGGSPYSVDPEAASGLGLTPRLTPETEAEIARCLKAPIPWPWSWFSAKAHDVWLPALLAEVQALREELRIVDGRRVAGVMGMELLRAERDAAAATFRGACRVLRALALVATGHEDPGNRITLSTANETYQQDVDEIMRCLLRAQRVGLAGLDDLRRLSEAATPGPWTQWTVAAELTLGDGFFAAAAVNYVRAMHARNNPLDTHANPK